MKWLLCVSTVCCSCPEKNHTFDHACRFPIVRMSPFSPYSCLSNHHWKGKKCPLVSLDSVVNPVLPLEVQTVHGLLLESKVVLFWMEEVIVYDSCVWNGVFNAQKTLGSASFWKEKKETGFLKWGLGYKPEGRSWVGLQWAGRVSLYWKMHLPEKGEWHEDLDLSVRVACVCMKQGETSSTKPREHSRWASYRIELLRIGGYYTEA